MRITLLLLSLLAMPFLSEANTDSQATKNPVPQEERFTIIYEKGLQEQQLLHIWSLLKDYNLHIKHSFEVDAGAQAIIVSSEQELLEPIEIGKELSVLKGVVFVQVRQSQATALNSNSSLHPTY